MFFNNQDIANAGVTEKAVLYSRSRFSRELSEIGAVKPDRARLLRGAPAAFRRLCVETGASNPRLVPADPAAFRRLCVETLSGDWKNAIASPAAFRRLCVETPKNKSRLINQAPAAFRRLCVETMIPAALIKFRVASRL